MDRRRIRVAGERRGRFRPSGLLRYLATLTAALQFIVACSGSDGHTESTSAGGQRAGGDSGTITPSGGSGMPQAGTTSAAGVTSEAGATSDAGAAGDRVGSSGTGGTSPDSEAGASGSPDGFVPAPHPPFPLITAHGGPVLSKIELVPVYFGADPLRSELESFATWLVASDYWKTVGADYGVLPGTQLPAVQFETAPTSPISVVQISSWLDAQIASAALPKPSAQTVFVLFYPAGTTITIDGSPSCSAFAGLHDEASIANAAFTGDVPFVVIPRCSFSPGDELPIATNAASHEIMEAATNPFFRSNPAWQMDSASGPLEAWQMLSGSEVADLCLNQSYDEIAGFTVQDMWSNTAAQAGNNPCQPSDTKHPYFLVSAERTIYHAQPGATLTIPARAWSNLATAAWSLGINWGYVPDSNFDGHASLSQTTVNNGDEVTATVTIPANPPAVGVRSVYRFTIDSIDPINPNFSHPWPLMIVVP